jgi:hypothetical protein
MILLIAQAREALAPVTYNSDAPVTLETQPATSATLYTILSAAAVAVSLVPVALTGGRFIPIAPITALGAAVLLLFGASARAWWPIAAATAARLAGIAIVIVACHGSSAARLAPRISLPILVAGVLMAAALIVFARGATPVARPVAPAKRSLRWTIAGGVFVLAMLTTFVVQDAMSTMLAPDTATYWTTPQDVFARQPGVSPIRTPQYSLLFAFVQVFGGEGQALLVVQFTARAVLAAAVAGLLSGYSLLAAIVVGVVLAIDPASAAIAGAYLTESAYTSAMLFSVVLALVQLAAPPRWRRWPLLVAAGYAIGFTLLVRPSSLLLLVVPVAAYGLVTRSAIAAALVGAGCGLAALTVAALQFVKTGLFAVVSAGLYVAFPLFSHQLFDPANGPVSARLERQLTTCFPGIDYKDVEWDTSNQFVYTKLLPCTLAAHGGNREDTYRSFGRAYREAFLAQPLVFTGRISLEALNFLSKIVAYYPAGVANSNRLNYRACNTPRPAEFAGYGEPLLNFVCPISHPDAVNTSRIGKLALWLRVPYQPYQYAMDARVLITTRSNPPPILTGVIAVVFFGFALFVVRKPYRPIVLASVLVILSNAGITALGHVTLSRYVAPLSPFFLIVSGLVFASVVEDVLQPFISRARPLAADLAPERA